MKLGFTGTRAGLTMSQAARLEDLLMMATEAHHGDCIGADEEFHELAIQADVPIIIHPPDNPKLRAYCEGAKVVLPEKPYLERNRDIVNDTDHTVACPHESIEPKPARGQGTWSCARYARSQGKLLGIYWP